MEKPLVEIDRMLFYKKEDGTLLRVQNAFRGMEGFYLNHGWYIYPDTIDMEKDFEIQMVDASVCRLIRETCTTDPTK
jgi:hypothetical protein